jgi:hypothetical protein
MEAIRHIATFLIVGGSGQKRVWRIMVPQADNRERRFSARHHLNWQHTVINISGGWTIHEPARGAWKDDGEVQFEKMRPVDIVCTAEQIKEIVEMTAHHYMQIEVLAYEVSNNIIHNRYEMYRDRGDTLPLFKPKS